jgi:hypothetical protein
MNRGILIKKLPPVAHTGIKKYRYFVVADKKERRNYHSGLTEV